MTLKSKVTVARPGSKSLRATVPEGIVEYLDLIEGDKLEWEMENDEKGGRLAVVHRCRMLKKVGPKS